MAAIGRIRDDEQGAGTVEYALLVGLIAMAAIVGLRFFGDAVSETLYSDSASVIAANTGH